MDNQFTAQRVGDQSVGAAYGETATLQVEASCAQGEIHYQWYISSVGAITGATDSTYTTEAVTEYTQYYCKVSDDFGNENTLNFYVRVDNQFTAGRVGSSDLYLAPGEAATLQVSASCALGEVHYQWYTSDGTQIAGATADSFTTGALTAYSRFYCRVSDDYGSSQDLWFWISIDNQLRASALGDSDLTVSPGETATLQVSAACLTGELHYQWYGRVYTEDGDYDEEPIEGATTERFTTPAIERCTCYYCRVEDDYGDSRSVYFYLDVDNGFTARRVGGYRVYAVPGDDVTLRVEASASYGQIRYQWYDFGGAIEGATGDSYTVHNITERQSYYCVVRDDYGHDAEYDFSIRLDTGLSLSRELTELAVTYGASVTLQASVRCDEAVSYRWIDMDWKEIEGATGDSYTTPAITRSGSYSCEISDQHGNTVTARFRLNVDSGFEARALSDRVIHLAAGESTTLQVAASTGLGEIHYYWEKDGRSLGEDLGDTLDTGELFVPTRYYLHVYDDYGGEETFEFIVIVDAMEALEVDRETTVTLSESGQRVWYGFTPAEAGAYTFKSTGSVDPWVRLYDDNYDDIGYDDDSSTNYNFSLTLSLEAGREYLVCMGLYEGSGSFTVTVTKGEDNQGTDEVEEARDSGVTFYLKKGQTVLMPPWDDGWDYADVTRLTSQNTDVLTVSGTSMTAVEAGEAELLVNFEGWSRAQRYRVVVLDHRTVKLPQGVDRVQEETFAGDDSIRFLRLREEVALVEKDAFNASGLVQLQVDSENTAFAGGALRGLGEFTLLCHPDSRAEQLAREREIPYLYLP